MKNSEIEELIEKYLNGTITSVEKGELMEWYRQRNQESMDWVTESVDEERIVKERVFRNIKGEIDHHGLRSRPIVRYRIAVAASILLMASVFLYVFHAAPRNPENLKETSLVQPVVAGHNQAVLKLADGSEILLNDQGTGIIAREGNSLVRKTQDGKIVYYSDASAASSAVASVNTITVPKGGQYQIVLPDGSKVWLNASSSLRFPTAFTGEQRSVELVGEGYFEIAKNAKMPFRVSANHTEVEVLGTHFNINAYRDEKDVKATLLEGEIRVFTGETSKVLHPGQQAKMINDQTSQHIVVENVDAAQLVAWKDGMFVFNNADLVSIMRELERWYDVEIEGKIPDEQFNGIIARNSSLSEVLKMIEVTSGLRFKIEERRVRMLP